MSASKTSVIRLEPNAVPFVIEGSILGNGRSKSFADHATKYAVHDVHEPCSQGGCLPLRDTAGEMREDFLMYQVSK